MKMPHSDGLNVVPLIDVILVLLAIVLSVATFIAQGEIKVALPSSSEQKLQGKGSAFVLKIDKDGTYFLNDMPSNLAEFEEKLNLLGRHEWVYLMGDKASPLDSFIQVINVLKRKNHANFKIITEYQ